MTKFVSTDIALVDCTRGWSRIRFYSGSKEEDADQACRNMLVLSQKQSDEQCWV